MTRDTNGRRLRITAYTLSSAAGDGRARTLESLRERRSGLTRNDFGPAPLATWIGRVPGLEEQPGVARPGRG
jgi:3-oxoacyl-[acyl-carrier-protein] synthase-1